MPITIGVATAPSTDSLLITASKLNMIIIAIALTMTAHTEYTAMVRYFRFQFMFIRPSSVG